MAYPGDTSRFGEAELADLGRQGPNDFFNGLLGQRSSLIGLSPGQAAWGKKEETDGN